MKSQIVLLAALLLSSFVSGQTIVTDRPDFTENATTVPYQHVQFELGANMRRPVESGTLMSFPNLLIRAGLFEKFELRLGIPGWATFESDKVSRTTFQPLLIESKIQIGSADIKVPGVIILQATLPTDQVEIEQGGNVQYGLKYAGSTDLTEKLGLGWNLGVFSENDMDGEKHVAGLYSVALGYSLSTYIGVFFEVFAEDPFHDTWRPVVDSGFTFLLNANSQLDGYIGAGLTDTAPDTILGIGFSYLL